MIEVENVRNVSGLMEYNTKKRKEFSTHGRDMSQAFIGYEYKDQKVALLSQFCLNDDLDHVRF